MMRRITRVSVGVAAIVCVTVTPAAATTRTEGSRAARTEGGSGGGFNGPVITHPESSPIDYPAGKVCDFPIHVEFPVDRVEVRTWKDDAGRPVFATAFGGLVMRVTNVATHRSVVRDISGSGTYSYPDSHSLVLAGNAFAVFLRGRDHPAHRLLVIGHRGFAAVRAVTKDGKTTKTVLVAHGPRENLCRTLSR